LGRPAGALFESAAEVAAFGVAVGELQCGAVVPGRLVVASEATVAVGAVAWQAAIAACV
jgi:hypothetical protein